MAARMTLKKFLGKARKVHGDEYDYSLVEYTGTFNKVKIICKEHGVFLKSPNAHFSGQGCPKCSRRFSYDTKEFIKRAKEKHGNKYDYSNSKYENKRKKVKIICKEHGEFEQYPRQHISGSNCPKCFGNFKYDTEEFIKKAKEVHGDKYDYSLTVYEGTTKKVDIICKKHGKFKQLANNHINSSKNGCPKCNRSKGEELIEYFLINNGIKYETQKIFESCRNINTLPFDFYLNDYNIVIEFDGEQHFKAVDFFGGEQKFKKTLMNDEIKNSFCKSNNIKILRINKIENIKKEIARIL